MFYSSVTQASDEMNSQAQAGGSTVSKSASKNNDKHLRGHCAAKTV